MKVKEMLDVLRTMDPEVQVAFFSRWAKEGDPSSQAEVVGQIVMSDLPHEGKAVRVVCLNPSFKALDYMVKVPPQARPTAWDKLLADQADDKAAEGGATKNRLLAKLVEALKPFADYAHCLPSVEADADRLTDKGPALTSYVGLRDYIVTFADLRKARAVYERATTPKTK